MSIRRCEKLAKAGKRNDESRDERDRNFGKRDEACVIVELVASL